MGTQPEQPRRKRFTRRLQWVWAALALLLIGLYLGSVPAFVAASLTVCPSESVCPIPQQGPEVAAALQAWGVSELAYALYLLLGRLFYSATCWAVAAVLIWRRPEERMARFTAFALLLFGTLYDGSIVEAVLLEPALVRNLYFAAVAMGGTGFFSLFFLFPDGHFVPRWTRWVVPGLTVFLLGQTVSAKAGTWPVTWLVVGLLASFAVMFYAQVHRFRHVSTPAQRQQTKWVVYAALVTFAVLSLMLLPELLLPWGTNESALYSILLELPIHLVFALVPCAIGVAIMRSRLWEIDVIIRRTLVYGVLSAALALIYFASVVLLQPAASLVLGEGSQVAVVASTLLVAILFAPLRQRVQAGIDRRFYRAGYNATEALAAFTAASQDMVDVEEVAGELLAVVRQTLQPATASLWLRGECLPVRDEAE